MGYADRTNDRNRLVKQEKEIIDLKQENQRLLNQVRDANGILTNVLAKHKKETEHNNEMAHALIRSLDAALDEIKRLERGPRMFRTIAMAP